MQLVQGVSDQVFMFEVKVRKPVASKGDNSWEGGGGGGGRALYGAAAGRGTPLTQLGSAVRSNIGSPRSQRVLCLKNAKKLRKKAAVKKASHAAYARTCL